MASLAMFRRLGGLPRSVVGASRASRSFGSEGSVHSWRRSPSGYMGSGGGDSEEDSSAPVVLVTGSCGQIGKEDITYVCPIKFYLKIMLSYM